MAERMDFNDLKLEVGLIKKDIQLINDSLNKLEETMEKMQQQSEIRRADFQTEVKELHSRINSTNKELTDKMDESENKIMSEFKSLRDCIMSEKNGGTMEDKKSLIKRIAALEKWKWMALGAIGLVTFVASNINIGALVTFFK
jgi:predicted  nucleic acid-binding Zn-ribbon protein